MKVLQVSPYYKPHVGGISTYVDNLIRYLDEAGLEVQGLALEGDTDRYVTCLKSSKLAFVSKATIFLRENAPDIVHSHSHWYTLMPGVVYKGIKNSKKLVFTFHTDPASSLPTYRRKAFEKLLSRCDMVTFVSNYLKERLKSFLRIQTKTLVISPGVEKKEFSRRDVRKFADQWHLKNSKPILTFIGPLVWKGKIEGVKRLISAFRRVKEELHSSELLIVGDGPFKKDLMKHSSDCGIADSVIFLGSIEDSRIALEATDIYTHISLQEGLPLALLEAMSKGLPIIASRTGGIPEAITHDKEGLLVSSDPDEIAEKILSLWSREDERKRLGKSAAIRAEKEFSWSVIAQKFIDVYAGEVP